jgi:hypothetical protein
VLLAGGKVLIRGPRKLSYSSPQSTLGIKIKLLASQRQAKDITAAGIVLKAKFQQHLLASVILQGHIIYQHLSTSMVEEIVQKSELPSGDC